MKHTPTPIIRPFEFSDFENKELVKNFKQYGFIKIKEYEELCASHDALLEAAKHALSSLHFCVLELSQNKVVPKASILILEKAIADAEGK